jgi:hypothetical protein
VPAGIASFATDGYGGWLVLDRATGEAVGFCALRAFVLTAPEFRARAPESGPG